MHEKYHDNVSFELARLRRGAVRMAMQPICHWEPIGAPETGYTLIIGCPAMMARVLFANLMLVQKQRRDHLREIIIGFDVTEPHADHALLDELRRRFHDLPLRFVFYSRRQAHVLNIIRWAWCYCWLNWVLPISVVRTRYAVVHDLDALLLGDDIFEQRYEAIRERGDHYVGVNYYRGNGLTEDDRLAVTFEMIFDAADLRQRNQPIDLFNCITRHQGRRVEFDTFLYPQRDRRRSVLAMPGEAMVHPTQLVCQYVELQRRRHYVPPERNNLPMLAYFHYLAGDAASLETQRRAFAPASGPQVEMFGRSADCGALSPGHVRWLTTQVERVEMAVAGKVRAPVRDYLDSLAAFVTRRRGPACRPAEASRLRPRMARQAVPTGDGGRTG